MARTKNAKKSTPMLDTTETPAPKSVMIATPMFGGQCSGSYVLGLLSTVSQFIKDGVPCYWAQLTNESLITRARNELVRVFLSHNYDYLMFIDADIAFDGSAVKQLMDADVDVVCGVYPKKSINWPNVVKAVNADVGPVEDFAGSFVLNLINDEPALTNEKGLVEVRHAGTGFMLIKRTVFETLAPHVPVYRKSTYNDVQTGEPIEPLTMAFFDTAIDETGALLSEDYYFCDLWRKHGGKVYVNPFVKLGHVGTHIFTGDILKDPRNPNDSPV